MDWEAIGAIGEVAGAFGVVVTLAFLAVQVRHSKAATDLNTHAVESRSESDAAMDFAAWHGRLASDPTLVECFDRVLSGADDLAQIEVGRFRWLVGELLFIYESQYRRWRRGLITEETWQRDLDVILSFIEIPVIRSFWQIYPFTPGYRNLIDQALSSGRPTNHHIPVVGAGPERPATGS